MTSCKHADGVYRVVSAPFDPPGAPDLESLRQLVGFLADTGAEALLVPGLMGEAPTLVARERDAVIATSVEAARSCPVIVGATNPSVAGTRALMRAAAAGGAAAVLIAPPWLDRAAGEDSLVKYVADVADRAELEVVPRDHPASSGVTLSAEAVCRITREVPESRRSSTRIRQHRGRSRRCARAPAGFKIFGGLGGMLLLEELRRAANETMTGSAYLEAPIEVCSCAHARGAGYEGAAVFFPYLALIRREFQEGVGLAIRKHIYKLRGLIEHDCVRSPGVELDSGTIAGLRELLPWSKLDEVAASA